jgi:cytochrome c oxidase cbb3-type subunit 2
MKSNFFFFVGLFAALLISWLGIVIGSNAQLGSLAPYYDDNDGTTHPEWMAGVAAQGQLEYRSLGCIACHTQQVRRPSFGSDQARGWGDRQSVARDYIYQPFPQLGLSRVGPDLTNVGDRKVPYDAADLLNLLYAGDHGMPSYKFLFETRRIGAEAQPSERALKLTGALKPQTGWEIVPTRRAEALVGYLVNLKTTYTYPEAVPFAAKAEGEAAKPAPASASPKGAPAPANAPGAPAATPAPSSGTPPAPAAATPAAPAPASGSPSAPAATPAAAPAPTPAAPGTTPAGSAPTPASTASPQASKPGVGPIPIAGGSSAPPVLVQPATSTTPPLPTAPTPGATPAGPAATPPETAPTPSPTAGPK